LIDSVDARTVLCRSVVDNANHIILGNVYLISFTPFLSNYILEIHKV